MKKKKFLPGLFFVLGLLICLIGSGCGGREFREDSYFSIEVKDQEQLFVSNHNGSVKMVSTDKSYLEIQVVRRSRVSKAEIDKAKIDIRRDEGKVMVETVWKEDTPQVAVSYEISVPQHLLVKDIQSNNGSIFAEGVAGNVKTVTSNGKITLKHIDGRVSADTSNGKIKIINASGLERAKTSNGSIEVAAEKLADGFDLNTSNGSVTLYIPQGADVDIEASTSNGSITQEGLSIKSSRSDDNRLTGTLGKGGPDVHIRTSNGNIMLAALEGRDLF